ncbi:GIY-YIG nuclease family protein [Methylobacterium sp. ID0610]|uniref:GIY-YIG nuclease family protein n=1 Tax=Methylobacterium carpenticola TaxID=3344827 RepID=UPI00369E5013
MTDFKPDLAIFGISKIDDGYIYIIEDRGRYKIGKTTDAKTRTRAAKTWLPDMRLMGIKPFWNVSKVERMLHEGFCRGWYYGEWFEFEDEDYKETLLDGFIAFSDEDRDINSVNFIYWFNGEGMAEFSIERARQHLSLPKFVKQESNTQKNKHEK